jgi:hypothetical protein
MGKKCGHRWVYILRQGWLVGVCWGRAWYRGEEGMGRESLEVLNRGVKRNELTCRGHQTYFFSIEKTFTHFTIFSCVLVEHTNYSSL